MRNSAFQPEEGPDPEPPAGRLTAASTFDEEDKEDETGSKMLKGLRSTLSASLRSIDISFKSGSLTSISSGRSIVSNFSVKSDSGISLPAGGKAGRRPRDSGLDVSHEEPEPRRSSGRQETPSSTERLIPHQYVLGEKEKSKVMQSVESKLMKAIKEVNESDIPEDSKKEAPLVKQRSRPVLVKQKHSFQFPSVEEEDSKVDEPPAEDPVKPVPKPFEPKKSFEDIKEEVKSMPPFSADRRKSSTDDAGGSARTSLSLDEAADEYGDLPTIVSSLSRKGMRKQSSLNEELMSRDRLSANVEMRKKITKQQSLPENDNPKKSLRESLMMAVSRNKQFESLRSSLSLWRKSQSQDDCPFPDPIPEEEKEEKETEEKPKEDTQKLPDPPKPPQPGQTRFDPQRFGQDSAKLERRVRGRIVYTEKGCCHSTH